MGKQIQNTRIFFLIEKINYHFKILGFFYATGGLKALKKNWDK